MAAITYYGHETVTYLDFIDLATGKTLVCVPGQTYNVQAVAGHPNVTGATAPTDGRFEHRGVGAKEPEQPSRRGVTKQDTSTPEEEE